MVAGNNLASTFMFGARSMKRVVVERSSREDERDNSTEGFLDIRLPRSNLITPFFLTIECLLCLSR